MENVETTTTTTVHEIEFTEDGERETTSTTATIPEVRHCECEDCQEWEEDIAHELTILRERVAELEAGHDATPATGPTETVVETTPEVDAEGEKKSSPRHSGASPAPRRVSRRGVGIFW